MWPRGIALQARGIAVGWSSSVGFGRWPKRRRTRTLLRRRCRSHETSACLAPPLLRSGRFLRPSYEGYRVLVTRADGSQLWVPLGEEGAPTFLHDYRAGGGPGAIHRAKRESGEIGYLPEVRRLCYSSFAALEGG